MSPKLLDSPSKVSLPSTTQSLTTPTINVVPQVAIAGAPVLSLGGGAGPGGGAGGKQKGLTIHPKFIQQLLASASKVCAHVRVCVCVRVCVGVGVCVCVQVKQDNI